MSNVKMPEPVTADEIRFGMRRIDADQQYIEVEQAEAYAQAVRDEAVKRARPTYFSDGYQAGWNSALDKAAEIAEQRHWTWKQDVAAAIRALKEQS